MDSKIKISLSIYGLVSTVSYIYLILSPMVGISVPIFMLLQFASIYLVIKDRKEVIYKKGTLLMIPMFILSLNFFISGSYIWRGINFLAVLILFSAMILIFNGKLVLKNLNVEHAFRIGTNIFKPFTNFTVPFKWYNEVSKNKERNILIKRILIGITISVPSVIFLLVMLSSADMIFEKNIVSFTNWIFKTLDLSFIIKLVACIIAGLYLFGHLYSLFSKKESKINLNEIRLLYNNLKISGDVLIINILLISILIVYTIFIGIQFRYLFAAGELPFDLNYSEYARRGFFELVFLSVLNIGLILITTYLLNNKIYVNEEKWAIFTKLLMIYLCIITGVLLVSSLYRMMLYDNEFGYTRLRIIVYLFLIFEAVGLIITLWYILKKNINIFAIYVCLGLIYYLTLNLISIDYLIAKRNIDMYFEGQIETLDVEYLTSLSVDITPQLLRLLEKDDEIPIKIINYTKVKPYLKSVYKIYNDNDFGWQSYNLSTSKAMDLIENNKAIIGIN